MKDKIKSWLIPIVIVVILITPIIVNYINGKNVAVKDFGELTSAIDKGTSALVYVGSTESEDFENVKETLITAKEDSEVEVFAINKDELSEDQLASLTKVSTKFEKGNVLAFVIYGEIRNVVETTTSKTDVIELAYRYTNDVVDSKNIGYKTVNTYKDYMKIVEGKKVTMSVFGRNSCSWCNRFKPIYNEVANEYGADIYYFDSDSYDATEYKKIMKSSLYIPASCTEEGKNTSLEDGFGTPLTLFTQKGKVVGCISGFVNKTKLINKLQSLGMIK